MSSKPINFSDTIYCKGKLLGYSEPGRKSLTIGKINFSEFSWKYIHIDDVKVIEQYNSEELKVGDFWYKKELKGRKNCFFARQFEFKWPISFSKKFPFVAIHFDCIRWPKRPEIFIPRGDSEFFNGTLYEVIISDFKISDKRSPADSSVHLYAEIYFQIKKPPIKVIPENIIIVPETTAPVINEIKTVGDGLNVLPEDISSTTTASDPVFDSGQNTVATPSKSKSSLMSLLIWFAALFIAWKFFPLLVLPIFLIGLSTVLFRFFKKSCLLILFSLFVFIVGGFLLLYFLSNNYKTVIPQDNRKGTIKISPPKAQKNKDGTTDFTTEKEIHWWDFYKADFWARYNTSNTIFYESQQRHQNIVSNETTNNSIQFFTEVYGQMNKMDNYHIDSLTEIFITNAAKLNLSPIRTAEMVTTFIQEIPYYLVHDLSCQESCKQGGFTAQYHSENKPCLPDIPAGVQSPYEFIHNLKGDCDTRSLLAYSILKKMGISCSVWVSEAYGHSILGVGLPIGTGTYKQINGVKHYAVELTAKGFKIGMISPEHTNTDNWDITLFYNKY